MPSGQDELCSSHTLLYHMWASRNLAGQSARHEFNVGSTVCFRHQKLPSSQNVKHASIKSGTAALSKIAFKTSHANEHILGMSKNGMQLGATAKRCKPPRLILEGVGTGMGLLGESALTTVTLPASVRKRDRLSSTSGKPRQWQIMALKTDECATTTMVFPPSE